MTESDLAQQLEDIEALFVQTARNAEHAGGRVVLKDVGPSTLYFSDRPQRVTGHIGTPEFIGIWGEGDDSFASNPPNAVLSFLGDGGVVPEDVVVELRDPILVGSDLSYAVTFLDGSIPERTGSCSLFIDTFGRPLTPVSVAGMRRRTRRRTRRRIALVR